MPLTVRLHTLIQWIRKFIREKFHSKNESLPYYITILIAFFLFVIALKAFIELTDELAENELTTFDSAITHWILSFRTATLTAFFEVATELGDRVSYVLITIALTAFFYINHKGWKFIVQTILCLLLSTLSNIGLKKIINRERPSIEHLVTVNTLSYPSGHSMSAMAFYGFLIYLCLRFTVTTWLRTLLITLLILLILSIGISRIYLGVHYPSDVAAGFIGGFIWITFCAVTFNIIELLLKRRKSLK
jgi:membrane-associated phospholipid phosphatase